jgi:S1-C subfamily serine protease
MGEKRGQSRFLLAVVASLVAPVAGCEKRQGEMEIQSSAKPVALERPAPVSAQAADESPPVRSDGASGLTLQTWSPVLGRSLGVHQQRHGAVVSDATPDGLAARAGVAIGDVIVAIGGRRISSADEAIRLLQANDAGKLELELATVSGDRVVRLAR